MLELYKIKLVYSCSWFCIPDCVCVCVREREKEREYVCVRERESVCVCERECVCVLWDLGRLFLLNVTSHYSGIIIQP